ncbi:MAG: LemA family protein [Candidatus Altiarchaeales archaeon]|nr:LemA family protein [Candidatus Altiarchaeales archaeon]MBD3417302.1 LemA family protein [Candidatus Altiarchaeales archaeon]
MLGGLVVLGLLVLGGLGFIVLAVVIMTYNSLVTLRNRCENAWSQIDVQLKRRNDLIPNLVETVKGYAAHEQETFTRITEARAAMANAQTVKEKASANNMLTGALKSLFAVVENYPDLKANQNFMQLQEELTTTENKISYARQFYNDSVMKYDTSRQTFPNNIIAGMFHFVDRDYFEVEEAAREVPNVDFKK